MKESARLVRLLIETATKRSVIDTTIAPRGHKENTMALSDTQFPADEHDLEGQVASPADESATDSPAQGSEEAPETSDDDERNEEVEGQSMPFRRN